MRAHVIQAGELLLGRMDASATAHGRGHRPKPGGSQGYSWPTGGALQSEGRRAAWPNTSPALDREPAGDDRWRSGTLTYGG